MRGHPKTSISRHLLKDIVVQATGAEKNSSRVKAIVSSFKALNAFADFSAKKADGTMAKADPGGSGDKVGDGGLAGGIQLAYTINLHLPPTPDIAVFDAIFRSLKEHLIE